MDFKAITYEPVLSELAVLYRSTVTAKITCHLFDFDLINTYAVERMVLKIFENLQVIIHLSDDSRLSHTGNIWYTSISPKEQKLLV